MLLKTFKTKRVQGAELWKLKNLIDNDNTYILSRSGFGDKKRNYKKNYLQYLQESNTFKKT
jgi:hypothetical protein